MSKEPHRLLVVCYFASVRERVGLQREEIAVPPTVVTIADLVAHLRRRGEGYERAFTEPKFVRAALDHVHAKPDAAIGSAREVAFFPPVTGG